MIKFGSHGAVCAGAGLDADGRDSGQAVQAGETTLVRYSKWRDSNRKTQTAKILPAGTPPAGSLHHPAAVADHAAQRHIRLCGAVVCRPRGSGLDFSPLHGLALHPRGVPDLPGDDRRHARRAGGADEPHDLQFRRPARQFVRCHHFRRGAAFLLLNFSQDKLLVRLDGMEAALSLATRWIWLAAGLFVSCGSYGWPGSMWRTKRTRPRI